MEGMKGVCEEKEILMMADEVMRGFGGSGKMFGMEDWGRVGDMMVVGKGMRGGYCGMGGVV
ncbi:aminotransferase class III-fold pyridoxal phosphate-dependent enzyme [Bacillus altitudinis]|uniref:aminotransferase class III-fold pyridoxal phosphate-dependent enzyme n=1 Tax=Bacillus altitudinis TaxID=293387 RepID=UPI003B519445